MFDSSSIIVGLEVGTSKICAVVGELGPGGALNIVGLGQAPSRGVRKGEIVDPAQAEEDIRNAIVEAERMADVEIRSVYLGVSGAHVQGFNNRGVHPIVSADREISAEDVADVLKNAKTIGLAAADHVIHAIRQHFWVDGQAGIANPVGLLGGRLEVDVHIVHGQLNRLKNAIRTVKGLQLEVEDIVFTGLATALALLGRDQKELGSLVIDLGGGTTDYVVYADGIVKHTGVVAVGGDHVTNDLAIGLKVALGRAEQLKVTHGAALPDRSGGRARESTDQAARQSADPTAARGETIDLTNEFGLPLKTVSLEHLRRIMTLRLEETLALVREDVEQAGLYEHLRAGVYLSGGGARIPRMAHLAESVFGLPVFLGRANSLSGLKSALDQPEFAAGIGLVKFGANRRAQKPRRQRSSILGKLADAVRRQVESTP